MQYKTIHILILLTTTWTTHYNKTIRIKFMDKCSKCYNVLYTRTKKTKIQP